MKNLELLEGSTLKSGRKGMLLIEAEKAKCYYSVCSFTSFDLRCMSFLLSTLS